MKVLQIVPDIYDESAGTAYAVPSMARGLVKNGVDVELWALGKMPRRKFDFPVRLFKREKLPVWAMGRSPAMLKALEKAAKDADIIHTNSIWMFPNVYPAWAAKGTKCKTIISPHGTVSRWAMSRARIKKFLFGHLFQYSAMCAADMFVVSCQEEADDLRRLGYKQPIAIVPNGIEVSEEGGGEGNLGRRRMYFLSRIHPKKNVELLIRCWSKLENEFGDWDLSIVGRDKDNEYADELKRLVRELGCKRITFEGELNGESKNKFVTESEVMVLPTHSENFGMVVAEALAHGTTVICSKGAPWGGLNDNHCGWWVDATESEFMGAMYEAMGMSREKLVAMGRNGREWMKRDFTWEGICAKLKAAYEWLLNGGERPEWVQELKGVKS